MNKKISQLETKDKLLGEEKFVIADGKKNFSVDSNQIKEFCRGLSTEDFTLELLIKLNSLKNYDDTDVRSKIESISLALERLIGSEDVTETINTFNEIEEFLKGITNSKTLVGLLMEMKKELLEKIDPVISKFSCWGCYRTNGDYRESASGKFRNSGLQLLTKNHSLLVKGICGDAGMGYVTYWDADKNFISALTLTKQTNQEDSVEKTISHSEFPNNAEYYIISTEIQENSSPEYYNGLTFERLVETVANQNLTKQDKIIDSEDITLENNKLSITEEAKRQVFIDMWNEACGEYGTYNHDTGFFELNEITDITYEQAIAIMNAGKPTYNGGNASRYYQTKIRTNLPLLEKAYSGVATGMKMFAWSWSLESVNAVKLTVSEFFFELSSKIHTIIGPFYCLSASPAGCFSSCSSLRKMQMVIGSGLIVLKDSPLINLESWNYIIEHKQNPTTNISTIQVHPNVYAKLTGDTSNATAAALTEEELAQWMALVEIASSKNISFTV